LTDSAYAQKMIRSFDQEDINIFTLKFAEELTEINWFFALDLKKKTNTTKFFLNEIEYNLSEMFLRRQINNNSCSWTGYPCEMG